MRALAAIAALPWLALAATGAAAAETFDIGRSAAGDVITAAFVPAGNAAAPTVLLVGGLARADDSRLTVERELAAYERLRPRQRGVNVVAIALANPAGATLQFPPSGVAYREHPESHLLWRWIAAHGPDLVLVAGDDAFGLGAALAAQAPLDVGRVPSRSFTQGMRLADLEATDVPPSPARLELTRRLARSPRQLADELARVYGRNFDQPTYIPAVAMVARLKLGHVDEIRALVAPYVDGTRDSLERPNSLVMAGHVVFTELARLTGDARYTAAVRRVAELGFDANGAMRESLPYHNEFSDSVFMGTVPAAQAGALTGERKYFDLAARHVAFMQRIDLRADGLYRHQPATDAAWGRGNAFAAIGLALSLGEFPADHPGRAQLLASYRAHMAVLLRQQNRDGLWRNVVDVPGSYPEYSATAMIGFSMLRGVENGWLEDAAPYRAAVDRAWRAVNARTGSDGSVIDVCESTARIETLEGYLGRAALSGRDDRAGAMAMLFATELMD
jgi:unsaturated rhamnogalacturonyl hydrolase